MVTAFALLYLAFFIVAIIFFIKGIIDKKNNKSNGMDKIIAIVSAILFVVFFVLTGIFNEPTIKDVEQQNVRNEEVVNNNVDNSVESGSVTTAEPSNQSESVDPLLEEKGEASSLVEDEELQADEDSKMNSEVDELNNNVDLDNPIETNSLQDLFLSLPEVTGGRDEIDFYLKEYDDFKSHKFSTKDQYYIGLIGSAVSSRPRDRSGESIVIYFTLEGDIIKATYTDYPGQAHIIEYRDGLYYFDDTLCESGEYAMQLYLLN